MATWDGARRNLHNLADERRTLQATDMLISDALQYVIQSINEKPGGQAGRVFLGTGKYRKFLYE
jgi:hypothetical protein